MIALNSSLNPAVLRQLERCLQSVSYEPRARTSITNESNLTGGESVGGSSVASVAPAESSDDDDGGGDDDDDDDTNNVSVMMLGGTRMMWVVRL